MLILWASMCLLALIGLFYCSTGKTQMFFFLTSVGLAMVLGGIVLSRVIGTALLVPVWMFVFVLQLSVAFAIQVIADLEEHDDRDI